MARSAAKRFIGTLLFVLAFFAVLGFVFLLFAEANNVDSIPGTDNIPNLGLIVTICLAAIIFLLILLFIIRRYDAKEEQAESAEAFFVPDADRAAMEGDAGEAFDQAFEDTTFHQVPDLRVYDLAELQIEAQAWEKPEEDDDGTVHPWKYPRDAPDAVFTNDYIPIGGGLRLKHRTLLAGPKELRPIHEQPKGAEAADEPVESAEDLEEMLEERERKMMESGELDAGYEGLMSEEERAEEIFYHFPSDPEPLSKIESIGDAYAEKLAQHGVKTTHRLAYEDADDLAGRSGIDADLITRWKAESDLLLVKGIGPGTAAILAEAGITVDALRDETAHDLFEKVQALGADNAPSESKLGTLQDAANELPKRSRLQVPAS